MSRTALKFSDKILFFASINFLEYLSNSIGSQKEKKITICVDNFKLGILWEFPKIRDLSHVSQLAFNN